MTDIFMNCAAAGTVAVVRAYVMNSFFAGSFSFFISTHVLPGLEIILTIRCQK
jgi:hypothetical protein